MIDCSRQLTIRVITYLMKRALFLFCLFSGELYSAEFSGTINAIGVWNSLDGTTMYIVEGVNVVDQKIISGDSFFFSLPEGDYSFFFDLSSTGSIQFVLEEPADNRVCIGTCDQVLPMTVRVIDISVQHTITILLESGSSFCELSPTGTTTVYSGQKFELLLDLAEDTKFRNYFATVSLDAHYENDYWSDGVYSINIVLSDHIINVQASYMNIDPAPEHCSVSSNRTLEMPLSSIPICLFIYHVLIRCVRRRLSQSKNNTLGI